MKPENQIDRQLDEITIRQLTWKPGPVRDIAAVIVDGFIRDRIKWSDEVDLSFVAAENVNCIGMVWRLLTTAGIIAPMGQFRRSTRKPANGRRVFKYRLASLTLAETWLERNGRPPRRRAGQMEMAL